MSSEDDSSVAAEATPASATTPSAPSQSSTSSSSSATPLIPLMRVKPGNFSRLLYTNPVCLLTSAAKRIDAAASNQTCPTPFAETAAIHEASDLSASSTAPSTDSAPSSTPSPLPSRNVMTISWLTATSNHGEFVASMNHGRYTTTFVSKPGDRFVLNVPVKGMEELVKAIGGCSGRDCTAAASGAQEQQENATSNHFVDKIAKLRIPTCRPGNKPLFGSSQQTLVAIPQQNHKQPNKNNNSNPDEEELADADDAAYNLFAIPSCVAQLVCEVTAVLPASDATPMVQAHNVLFCKVLRAYAHKEYFVNANFVAPKHMPPYLTFLGNGNFAYVTK